MLYLTQMLGLEVFALQKNVFMKYSLDRAIYGNFPRIS